MHACTYIRSITASSLALSALLLVSRLFLCVGDDGVRGPFRCAYLLPNIILLPPNAAVAAAAVPSDLNLARAVRCVAGEGEERERAER